MPPQSRGPLAIRGFRIERIPQYATVLNGSLNHEQRNRSRLGDYVQPQKKDFSGLHLAGRHPRCRFSTTPFPEEHKKTEIPNAFDIKDPRSHEEQGITVEASRSDGPLDTKQSDGSIPGSSEGLSNNRVSGSKDHASWNGYKTDSVERNSLITPLEEQCNYHIKSPKPVRQIWSAHEDGFSHEDGFPIRFFGNRRQRRKAMALHRRSDAGPTSDFETQQKTLHAPSDRSQVSERNQTGKKWQANGSFHTGNRRRKRDMSQIMKDEQRKSRAKALNHRPASDAAPIEEARRILRPRFGSPLLEPKLPDDPMPNQPYSVPEPHLFPPEGHTNKALAKRVKGLSFEDTPTAGWFADRASPPVLITFDAFGTLFEPKAPVTEQYADEAKKFGHSISAHKIRHPFSQHMSRMRKRYPNYGRDTPGMSYESWWHMLIERVLTPLLPSNTNLHPDLVGSLYTRFASAAGYRLMPGVQELLTTIGSGFSAAVWPPRRTMLGLLSDSDPRVRQILTSFGVGNTSSPRAIYTTRGLMYPPRVTPNTRGGYTYEFPPADFAFESLSYETGMEKHKAGVFENVAKTAQERLSSMQAIWRLTRNSLELLHDIDSQFWKIHIGNQFEDDVLPALKAGWDAVLYDPSSEHPITTKTTTWNLPGHGRTRTRKYTIINSLHPNIVKQLVSRERIEQPFLARKEALGLPLAHRGLEPPRPGPSKEKTHPPREDPNKLYNARHLDLPKETCESTIARRKEIFAQPHKLAHSSTSFDDIAALLGKDDAFLDSIPGARELENGGNHERHQRRAMTAMRRREEGAAGSSPF
ncbi:MAG: hypothetical protein M1828_000172 [Chrysothrix sp. TS-e1954]|nr:MAG: hypothetical protein M1828_000172 [Chrysothrix sp. TS-e1954]